MLCQLSYRGLLGVRGHVGAERVMTLAYRRAQAQPDRSPAGGRVDVAMGQDGRTPTKPEEGTVLIRYVVVLGLGYVLGTRAGRRRYEQIVGTYRALTGSPAAKSMIEAGRRKVADRVSPDARMVTLTEIDDATSVVEREQSQS
jgi:hypothetical protein